jgi:hypothetical protein
MHTDLETHHAGVAIDARGIATVTIRHAGSLNLLSTPVIADVRQTLQRLGTQDSVRVVVLAAASGRASWCRISSAHLDRLFSASSSSEENFDPIPMIHDEIHHFMGSHPITIRPTIISAIIKTTLNSIVPAKISP